MSSTPCTRLRRVVGHLPQCNQTSATTDAMYRYVDVLDSRMAYVDTGNNSGVSDNIVIFLHGNPTSSYLWRNVIPHVRGIARCIAPDLIGMGRSGKSGNGSYRYVDHYRYLCAWIDKVAFNRKITVVCHDWGSGLGLYWCHQHADRVQAIVFMEALIMCPPSWDFFPDSARNIFTGFRSEAGEDLVIKKNYFVERVLPAGIIRKLTDDEMGVYRAPYLEEGESRRPTLTWPREIPILDEGPADVVEIVNTYGPWLAESADIPKLYIDAKPGLFSRGLRLIVPEWKNTRTVQVKGKHYLQEDSPVEIGQAIAKFLLTDVYK